MNALDEEFKPPSASWWKNDALVSCTVVGATLLSFIALGHEGRRVAQLAVLAAPLLMWLAWPARNAWVHRLRTSIVWLWVMAFAVDAVVRAHLSDAYQAAPDSALVLSAAANTNARESFEYVALVWRSMVLWAAALAAAGLVVGRFAQRGVRLSKGGAGDEARSLFSSWPRWTMALVCVLLLVASIAYASKPWRRHHPVLFWTNWTQSVQTLRAEWANQQQVRERVLKQAQALAPVVVQEGPATVMLVIADSINRDNMALYGYSRPTTPRLLAHKAQLNDRMLVLRNAWSVDASTLPSLRNLFAFGLPESEDPPHVLALARAAGYKVWWISNHDDVAIEQKHARLANVTEMVNRTPGRASASLDGKTLDHAQQALRDAAPRKLIVVQLMGAHPHYGSRFPADANPFDDGTDTVETQLVNAGRPAWIRGLRQEYDAALLYNDFVTSELLRMTREPGKTPEHRAWMYLSDHGQEVGHESNRAGHSPSTASGYRIPTVIWHNRLQTPSRPGLAEEPFRADWAGWALTDLLNIQWAGHLPQRDVLHKDYRWNAPNLPAVKSFTQ